MSDIKVRTNGTGWRMVPTGDITPYDRNAKIHGEDQVERLRTSLRTFGFVRPLLVDESMGLIAGHGMLAAARAEGMSHVPCLVVSGLSDAQRRAYIHADNKLAELAVWDMGLLDEEIRDLGSLGIDMEALGFDGPIDAVEFEAFDGQGDGGGSQVSDGTKFRVVLGPLIFDLEDSDHALYQMAKAADASTVQRTICAHIRSILEG